jgi:hypothetical protein
LNSFTHAALSCGWCASSHAAKLPWLDVALAVSRHGIHVEAGVGRAEAFALLQDGFPAQAGLVDFQQQPFEQLALVALREAVFVVVVMAVDRVAGGDEAVAAHGRDSL